MNRRSFIARTIAAASALVAGKSVAETVPDASDALVASDSMRVTVFDPGEITDVITSLGGQNYRRDRYVTDENGTSFLIDTRTVEIPAGSWRVASRAEHEDVDYSDE